MDLSWASDICWMEWDMRIVSELSGEEVVVRNLFTQRKQSAGRQQLREYWHARAFVVWDQIRG